MVDTLKPPPREDRVLPGATVPPAGKTATNLPDVETVLLYCGVLEKAEEERRMAARKVSGIRKQMKNVGINMEAFDKARVLVEMDSADAGFDYIEQFVMMAQAFGVPVGKAITVRARQLSLIPTPEERLAQAYQDGKMLGLVGKNPDHQKWPIEAPEGQEHVKGWNMGQAILMERKFQLDGIVEKLEEECLKKEGAK